MSQLTLNNTSTGTSLTLYNAQESQRGISGQTDVNAPIATDRAEVLITQLVGTESATITGRATANRVSNESGYSNDPVTALAEWVADLESYCHSQQGSVHELADNDRSETRNVVVKNVSWQREGGNIYDVQYIVEFAFGTSPGAYSGLASESVNPSASASIGGQDMGSIKNVLVEIEQPFDEFAMAFHDSDAFDETTEYLANGGSTRTFTITGTITGATARNNFDDHVRSLVRDNTTATYNEAWPGRSFDVVVTGYEATHESGNTRLGDYNIELTEGRTL